MSGVEDLDADLPDRREPADAVVRILEIVNKKGLHARASAKFVQTAERFDAHDHGSPAATKPWAAPRSWG